MSAYGISSLARTRWRFGAYELAPSTGRLLQGGSEIEIAPKSLRMLVYLIQHRERIVTREELLREVWGETTVSDAAISSVIRDLRRSLSDTATNPTYIETYRARGLRFVHDVHDERDAGPASDSVWDAIATQFERALNALEIVEASRGQLEGGSPGSVPRERSELMVALARARWSAGATDIAREAFLAAAELSRRSGDVQLLAQAALGFVGRSDVTPGVNQQAVALLEEAIAAMPPLDSPLLAELLARLGTELYYDPDAKRSDELTCDALEMAERVGDRAVTAYALTTRHFASQRPNVLPQQRIQLADRAIDLVAEGPASDVLAFALQERMVDLLECGEGPAFEEALTRFAATVDALGQPFFDWLLSMFRGTHALLSGRIDEAESLAGTTLAIGLRIGSPNAEGAFAGQLFSVRREQGRLHELAPAFADVADRHLALPIFRAGRAAVVAASGGREAAGRALEEIMANDLDDFPRDQNWIATLGTLAPVAVAAGNARRARQLVALLLPYRDRMIVVGQGATTHGAVSHHLGTLHATLGESKEAVACFDLAEAIQSRAGAAIWTEWTRRARNDL